LGESHWPISFVKSIDARIYERREKKIDRQVKMDAQRERNKIQGWDSGQKE
jgi:hypothetical protein